MRRIRTAVGFNIYIRPKLSGCPRNIHGYVDKNRARTTTSGKPKRCTNDTGNLRSLVYVKDSLAHRPKESYLIKFLRLPLPGYGRDDVSSDGNYWNRVSERLRYSWYEICSPRPGLRIADPRPIGNSRVGISSKGPAFLVPHENVFYRIANFVQPIINGADVRATQSEHVVDSVLS